MMLCIWTIVAIFGIISLVTFNPASLIAGLILASIGILVERFYK